VETAAGTRRRPSSEFCRGPWKGRTGEDAQKKENGEDEEEEEDEDERGETWLVAVGLFYLCVRIPLGQGGAAIKY
jgi:hypothetical protein